MQYSHTSIYSLEIEEGVVKLFFCWEVYPMDSSVCLPPVDIKINAKQIYWEPVRDLVDPYW
ncbi:MAG: hypothetical protein SP4CHLAM5_11420 [Chlamydiia bacterium]|nr:hypothetical protein [Chlamydiia bacterium]